ncbi:MAG TPA: hypothetical protein VNG33_00565, partial [Polyangiaceae bacterium]|nr:hypothetical protein [Polyangiaceae bacterium]
LFQNCNYNVGGPGWSAALMEGKYTTNQLAGLGALDDDTSSLVLAPGYDATLYEDDNFGGRSVTMHDTLGCFVRIGMNDQLSSIEIRASGMTAGGNGGAGAGAGGAGPSAGTGAGTAGSGAGGGGDAGSAGNAGQVGAAGGVGGGGTALGSGGPTSGSGGSAGTGPEPERANADHAATNGCSCRVGAQTEPLPWAWLALSPALFLARSRRAGRARRARCTSRR